MARFTYNGPRERFVFRNFVVQKSEAVEVPAWIMADRRFVAKLEKSGTLDRTEEPMVTPPVATAEPDKGEESSTTDIAFERPKRRYKRRATKD